MLKPIYTKKNEILTLDARGKLEWKNDGLCDDLNNNEACEFDGGDCCGVNVNVQFCIECKCISKLLLTLSKKSIMQSIIQNYFPLTIRIYMFIRCRLSSRLL